MPIGVVEPPPQIKSESVAKPEELKQEKDIQLSSEDGGIKPAETLCNNSVIKEMLGLNKNLDVDTNQGVIVLKIQPETIPEEADTIEPEGNVIDENNKDVLDKRESPNLS